MVKNIRMVLLPPEVRLILFSQLLQMVTDRMLLLMEIREINRMEMAKMMVKPHRNHLKDLMDRHLPINRMVIHLKSLTNLIIDYF